MKTMNTSTIFDESKSLLSDLYSTRLGDMDVTVPEIQRAVLELKMYHLPPMYEVEAKIRNRVALRPEISLFTENEVSVLNRATCQSCYNTKPLYGEHTIMCLECWSAFFHSIWKDFPIRIQNWTQILNCTSYIPDNLKFITQESWVRQITATTLKELQQEARQQLRFFPHTTKTSVECWTTPKKAFLVQELGCKQCFYTPNFKEVGWLWSADFSDWTNGYCPNCIDMDPSHNTIWGFTEQDYRQWQDSYTSAKKMQRTIARYGALSLLLVSPSANWANYITKIVPHVTAYSQRTRGSQILPETIGSLFTSRAHTLNELNINLDEVLPNVPSH